MDWQTRMETARAEYADLDSKENEVQSTMQSVMQDGNEALAAFALRKKQLEGQMSIIGELLTDGLPVGDWSDAQSFEHIAQNPANSSDTLPEPAYPGSAALATLNGINQRNQDQDA